MFAPARRRFASPTVTGSISDKRREEAARRGKEPDAPPKPPCIDQHTPGGNLHAVTFAT
jgi:hypothetical protein